MSTSNAELYDKIQELLGLYQEVKQDIRRLDKMTFERWKVGGYLVDSDIISMYPNLEKISSDLDLEDPEDTEKSDDSDDPG